MNPIRFRGAPASARLVPGLFLALVAIAACALPAPEGSGAGAGNPSDWQGTGAPSVAEGMRGGVASTDAWGSEAGLNVLREGGNAVDAAIATAFALAVVNPEAGNLGGGGFLVLRMADGETAALDFRETAPAASNRDMFLDDAGALTDRSVVGHLASGVPGSVRGLWEAHQRYGTLPWARLVEPAITLADGHVLRERLARSLAAGAEVLSRDPETRRVFLPGGAPPAVGDTFRQPDLAATLRRIRDGGADGFYRGETAQLLVAEMQEGGGILTRADLEGYRAVWREPLEARYRGRTLISMPPPSSGGATMGALAAILDGYDLAASGWHAPRSIHLYAEAARRAFADRNELLADPDFHSTPAARMVDPAYAAVRRATIDPDRATPSLEVRPGAEDPLPEPTETTHLSVVDPDGNAVSLTTTINSWFGSGVTVAGAGFLLNNEMDDFAARPGHPNQFGLVQGERNAIEPGKRMLSAMTPTIVLDPEGRLEMVVGSPGGPTIITTVFQVISNVVDHGMSLPEAVRAPRIHHQHLPDQIYFEPAGLPAGTRAALEELGHRLVERDELSGDVHAIRILPDGRRQAVSDPRRGGTALAW